MSYLRQTLNSQRLKSFNETFRNIKYYLVNNKINKIVFDINNTLREIKKMNVSYTFINLFPKQIFELLIIVIFSYIILNFTSFSKDLNNLVPSLALYAAASFRILPSMNKIILKFNELRYSRSAIEVLGKELENEIHERKNNTSIININFHKLSFKNVSFKYENRTKNTLENISLDINNGKIYGFIGETGSGKTTFSDLIMCLQKVSDGKILLNNDKNLYDFKYSWQSMIGYVPQNIFIFDQSIKNNIAFGEFNNQINLDQLNNSIKQAQLENFINSLDEGIETIVGENGSKISGGQLQRIGIARALYLNPQILILDEVTSSLDLDTEKQILNVIENLKGKKTIILITHKLNALKVCDEIFQIKNGKLYKI